MLFGSPSSGSSPANALKATTRPSGRSRGVLEEQGLRYYSVSWHSRRPAAFSTMACDTEEHGRLPWPGEHVSKEAASHQNHVWREQEYASKSVPCGPAPLAAERMTLDQAFAQRG